MRRNRLTSSTESRRGSLDDDWTEVVGLDVYGGFTFLTSDGSWASINGVCTGFHHIPLEVEFPRAQNPP